MQNKQRHIVHLSAVRGWGGGENHIENLCHELQDVPGVKNTIICVKGDAFEQRLKRQSIDYFAWPLKLKISPIFAFKVLRFCKKEKVDLVHIHDPTALVLAIIADAFGGMPPFVYSKKTSFPIRQKKGTLFKYNYPKIKKVFCVSNETKKIAAGAISIKEKLVTLYHGTNLATKSIETPFLLREKLNLKSTDQIVGNIANHIPAKDLPSFLKAAHHIVYEKKHTNITFVQIGTATKLTPELLELRKALKLEPYVHFLGYLPDASNFIPQFDVSCVSSESEGIPQFIYESFYHKIPVVSTRVGGIGEVVADGKTGFLVPMHAPELLAKKIMIALSTEQRSSLVEEANQLLHRQFTTQQMAVATLKTYQQIWD